MEGLYPWKCHQGELVKVSEVFWRLRFQARWFQIDMQFPHMSSCCAVGIKRWEDDTSCIMDQFWRDFTTPSPRYDYMISHSYNEFRTILYSYIFYFGYYTLLLYYLYCNANAKYCIFVQLRSYIYNQPFLSPKALRDGQRPSWGKCKKKESLKMLWIFIKTLI